MDALLNSAPELLARLWWPFCRVLAALSAAPILGDTTVPVRVRIMMALVISVAMLPSIDTPPIKPLSLAGAGYLIDQVLIGLLFGLAFHMVLAAFSVLGFLVASQMGLAMAVMNDPINGTSSDVVSSLLHILYILLFFSMDGHLLIIQIVHSSFHIWPLGMPANLMSVKSIVFQVGWVCSAALLLAVPIAFPTLVIQIGMGFLTRATPTLNLFSLGFSVTTMFGLLVLGYLALTASNHYEQMTQHILDFLENNMRGAHG